MPEKPPKNNIIYPDFKNKKILPTPPEDSQPRYPEITVDEARQIFQDIFDNFETRVWHLHGLVKKAREKFDAYEHLTVSSEYSEGHYRTFVNQNKPHRLGDKVGREKGITRIFNEDETRLYEKVCEYEKEFKDYIVNFLRDRESLYDELDKAHKHLKNVKGADELKEKLEKYLEKMDFDFASIVFIEGSPEGYGKKIEIMEKFSDKLIN